MSTVPPNPPGEPAVIVRPTKAADAPESEPELRIYSHSSIYYWWPIWVMGYILAALTYFDGERLVIVPKDRVEAAIKAEENAKPHGEYTINLPAGTKIGEHVANNKEYGVVFANVLLLVVFITNTPLRGLWSAVVVLVVLVTILVLALMHLWSQILAHMGHLSLHMNMGFYVYFSTALFILWALAVFVFDRMHYYKFRPGQLTYESWFGGGQRAYDTAGIMFEKLQSDPFRHYLLGLGSGDLEIDTSGAVREKFKIHNVLFVDRVLKKLQLMISEKHME